MKKTWMPIVPDGPSFFKNEEGLEIVDSCYENKNMFISFITLKNIKEAAAENCYGNTFQHVINKFTITPTILFMTYADLNMNLEFVLKFIFCGADLDDPSVVRETFVTAILCDEFHKPKNISDSFRKVLAANWEEEDEHVLKDTSADSKISPSSAAKHQPPPYFNNSVAETLQRFKSGFVSDKQTLMKWTKKKNSKRGEGKSDTSIFLSSLISSDSFRFMLELVKNDVFCLLASATPFQSNSDLHSIDHLLRGMIPAYTSISSFTGGSESLPDAIAENSEYSTKFLEEVIKLLRNRGQLVSRSISVDNVECSVVSCTSTPLQKFAMDELASYCLETRNVLLDAPKIGSALQSELALFTTEKQVREFVESINSCKLWEKSSHKQALSKIDYRQKIILLREDECDSFGKNSMKEISETILSPPLLSHYSSKPSSLIGATNDSVYSSETKCKDNSLKFTSTKILNKKRKINTVFDLKGSKKCRLENDDLFFEKNLSDNIDNVNECGEDIYMGVQYADEHDCQTKTLDWLMSDGQELIFENKKKYDVKPERVSSLYGEECSSACDANSAGVEKLFTDEVFLKRLKQYYINLASVSVAACKSSLLAIKSHSVNDAIKKLRISSSPKKAVMSLEQTGDSFLSGLAGRVFEATSKNKESVDKEKQKQHSYGLVDVNVFDSSPLANVILSGYRILCRALSIATAVKTVVDGNTVLYLIVMPRPPPTEPLIALFGNSLDIIEQCAGETKHAEISNRKLISRVTPQGMLVLQPNSKTTNTNKCIDVFNNTKEVDVMMLGPKGNTGMSLHDSRTNAVSAKRVHCLLDLPYNAVAFRQTIGRTHRNGQATVPHFLIFTTDSPSERRFFDSLESRVKDSKAGSFADRYSNNSLNMTAVVDREQFLDKGLVLKTLGTTIRIISSDIDPISLFISLSKMTISLKDSQLYAFVEGLDVSNSMFLDVMSFGLEIIISCLGLDHFILDSDNRIVAAEFNKCLNYNQKISMANAAGRVIFSNVCQKFSHNENDNHSSGNITRVLNSAHLLQKRLNDWFHDGKLDNFTSKIKDKNIVNKRKKTKKNICDDIFNHIYNNINNNDSGLEEDELLLEEEICGGLGYLDETNIFDAILFNLYRNAPLEYFSSSTNSNFGEEKEIVPCSSSNYKKTSIVTVRILGEGQKKNVISSSGYAIPSEIIDNIPLVSSTCVISTLMKENPSLVYRLYDSSLPHSSCDYPFRKSSYCLSISKKLSRGNLDFRQFQNNLFAPKSESELLHESFVHVLAIMARDERLDGMCESRMKNVIGASYLKVSTPPSCVPRSKLLNGQLKRHVARNIDDEYIRNGKEKNEKAYLKNHNVDVVLNDGSLLNLTPENSVFVAEHLDFFVAGSILGHGGKFLQLCFDNHDRFGGLPPFCIYNRDT